MQTWGYEVGMSDDEFWKSNLRSLQLRMRARGNNVKLIQQILAWHAAVTIKPHIKGTVQPSQLLGDSKGDNSREALDKEWDRRFACWLQNPHEDDLSCLL